MTYYLLRPCLAETTTNLLKSSITMFRMKQNSEVVALFRLIILFQTKPKSNKYFSLPKNILAVVYFNFRKTLIFTYYIFSFILFYLLRWSIQNKCCKAAEVFNKSRLKFEMGFQIFKAQLQLQALKPGRNQDKSDSPGNTQHQTASSPTMTSFLHR